MDLLTEVTHATTSRGSDARPRPTNPPPGSRADPESRGPKTGRLSSIPTLKTRFSSPTPQAPSLTDPKSPPFNSTFLPHRPSPHPTSSSFLDPMLHCLRSHTGVGYLQSSSTTLQVVLHGEAQRVPPPLAEERLHGEYTPPLTQALVARFRRRDSNPPHGYSAQTPGGSA